ncbi:unnamed protein product [Clonostachys rhizophaga]|uniref:Myb-like domain-containing protein n=1 Tax=Clonostachys rhizophaga TaxID=160324 RepID=A0A9N9VCT3_9HYPO|nr:unnamed protein product [Clonostachys rhizophaga]
MSLHPALSFGSSQPPRPLLLQPSLLASPPASPPTRSSSDSFAGNVLNSCLSLQSLMTAPTGTASDQLPHTWDQLPTPPLPHANLPLKLRLRRPANVDKTNSAPATPRRIAKRGTASRRLQKRRRCPQTQDHMSRDDSDVLDSETSDLELDLESSPTTPTLAPKELSAPATPKRARIAPEQLPLGLERADFHEAYIRDPNRSVDQQKPGTDLEVETDGQLWSAEDTRILFEVVLPMCKNKLSKREWQEVGQILGRDHHSTSLRFKSLIDKGEVEVKGRAKKTHGTW